MQKSGKLIIGVHTGPCLFHEARSGLDLRLAGMAGFWEVGWVIPQFNDHAANERTYLACSRTGIPIIAFGFVLERFSLFLEIISESFGGLLVLALSIVYFVVLPTRAG